MKILNVEQIRALDRATIDLEPITSLDLMERASTAFVQWFRQRFSDVARPGRVRPIVVFCGEGNNGGDGLAIARLLRHFGYDVAVYLVKHLPRPSANYVANRERLPADIVTELFAADTAPLPPNAVVIDALLGSGASRPAEGALEAAIQFINDAGAEVVSVDIASGLYADRPNKADDPIVQPTYTVTFQTPKLAFMQPQNSRYVGEWHVVDIGLHQETLAQTITPYFYTTASEAQALLRPRGRFSHKGTFGHALLLAGSYGKIGAAVLASRAALQSGVGLLTVQVPRCGYGVLQATAPEAMCRPDRHEHHLTGPTEIDAPGFETYSAVGMGPGIGQHAETLALLRRVLDEVEKPMVLDADALNLLSQQPDLLKHLPSNSILTPHPKEFERMAGAWPDDFAKLALLRRFALQYNVVIVLKGAHTAVALPNGEVHFNSTGNPGLSTGGTGDVLTGVLTALLAQGYPPADAARLGVYVHGRAADRLADEHGQYVVTASEVISALRFAPQTL